MFERQSTSFVLSYPCQGFIYEGGGGGGGEDAGLHTQFFLGGGGRSSVCKHALTRGPGGILPQTFPTSETASGGF